MAWLWVLAVLCNYFAALIVVAAVLRRRKEPMAMLAWIFAIISLPVVGMVFYGLVGANRIHRKAGRRRRRIAHLVARLRQRAEQRALHSQQPAAPLLPDDLAHIERMTRRLLHVPATSGNEIHVYEEANATYDALEEAIGAAEHHIHLEYYVWQPDETGRHFRDLLISKARAGVQCRVLIDSVGSWRFGRAFAQPLIDAGVDVRFFLPVNPLRKRWSINQRNHRKIAVFDGRVAFTGSQNIGDEYLGRRRKLSPWRDTHMRIRGPSVLFLQQTFAEDWFFATREDLTGDHYFPEAERPGESIVQIVATGPDQDARVLEQIIFAAVASARRVIRIAVAYFVPSPELKAALMHAAYCDVHVELVLPTRHDSLLSLWAGRSFYAELITAGVEIHEYDDGVLHSKIITIDDRWCVLGSANMDVRSFRLNFEITALVYDQRVANDLAASISRDRARARRITLRHVAARPLPHQLLEGVARLFSPLL